MLNSLYGYGGIKIIWYFVIVTIFYMVDFNFGLSLTKIVAFLQFGVST